MFTICLSLVFAVCLCLVKGYEEKGLMYNLLFLIVGFGIGFGLSGIHSL